MANKAEKLSQGASPVVEKSSEKEKAEAFVNWRIVDKDGNIQMRSQKGFPLFDNQYTNKAERNLVALAKKHGGKVTVNAQLIIALNSNEEFDIDSIDVVAD